MATQLELTVNGAPRSASAPEGAPLLHVLRNLLGLKAARFGCGEEACGACRVLVDGEPVYACTFPADQAAGRTVITPEGLAATREGAAVVDAFLAEQAGQCGYCLSGIVVAATALLQRQPSPDRAAILAALEPHLCRCGAHNRMVRAVERAARTLAANA
ncbi:MAG TPA: (2Fe-2S)-binding protein [Caulobacteraceae bacterium]|nr:(2Fe-2S)-binding protein [Caulobacteraceae bacterium]